MQQKILTFINNPKSKQIIINSFGNYLNVFFAFIFQLIFVRIFNPAEYGVLGILLVITYLGATILDFGTTATIYSYLPKHLEAKTKEIYHFLKSIFFYQTVFAGVIVLIFTFFFPWLDKNFFNTGSTFFDLIITSLAIMFFIWQNFFLNLFFAAKKFLRANIYLTISNIVKTLAILFLYFTDNVSIASVIFILGIFGVSTFLVCVLFDKRHHLIKIVRSTIKKEEMRLKYTFTFFIASQFLNFGMRIDLFIVSYFSGILMNITKNDIGYYTLAQRIVLVVVTFIISITQVLSPSFAAVKNKKDALHELWNGLLYIMMPIVIFIILAVTPKWAFEMIFTKDFGIAVKIIHLLTLPYILFSLANIPMLFLLYTVKKPKYILAAYSSFFIITVIGCYVLIPKLNIFGTAYALGAGFLAALIMLGIPAYKELQKL